MCLPHEKFIIRTGLFDRWVKLRTCCLIQEDKKEIDMLVKEYRKKITDEIRTKRYEHEKALLNQRFQQSGIGTMTSQ